MRVHSVQFKFITTVISAILAITVFVGGLSIYEVDKYVQQHTKEFIDTTCSNEVAQVNDILGDIENSVRIMESYVLSMLKKNPDFKDPDNQQEILQLAGDMFVDVADNTDGAIAYYFRFDPAISDTKFGIFYSKVNGSDDYVCLEPTDITAYDKTDVEHVGWFWQPYEAGHAIWMTPYYNQNNDILMISFVIPLYFENQFFGIVGMDFDYTVLTDRIHQIKIFEHGFAHLELDGAVIHSGNEHMEDTLSHDASKAYLQTSEDLINGMTLVLFASYDDVKQIRHEIAYKLLISAILLALAFSLIVFLIVKKLVKPLKEMSEAAVKLSNGDYDLEIKHSDTYEIQQLSLAFENMLINLREHKKIQQAITYRDPLTGLRNTTSYWDWIIDFNKKINEEKISFGVVVLDLNRLKEANDTYGHNSGNKLIFNAAKIISETFKRSPVFRIGGDEFVVILQNRDLADRDLLFEKFEKNCAEVNESENDLPVPISIARGFALFDPQTDSQFLDVFNRADDEMYKNKKKMKTTA